MPSNRKSTTKNEDASYAPIPFPGRRRVDEGNHASAGAVVGVNTDVFSQSADDVLNALGDVSRRINDLARELKCLGYFDDNPDRPRAA